MLIDWFTVIAQALNFLVLVWLMKRFLYQPILNAIDTREKGVAAELADADKKKAEAQKDRDEFQRKNEDFDAQRAALLEKAVDEAKIEQARLIAQARKESVASRASRQAALNTEFVSISDEISRKTRDEVFGIARSALKDLAETSLEERIAGVLVQRLHDLDAKEKASLKSALKASPSSAVVRSTFDLPAPQRKAIEASIHDILPTNTVIRYETSPDLVSGIEMSANGWKVGWNIADYLASFKQGLGEILKAPSTTEPKGT